MNIKYFSIAILAILVHLAVTASATPDAFVYSHGFGSTGQKALRYVRNGVLPPTTTHFNYQDARLRINLPRLKLTAGLNIWDTSLAQDPDVRKLAGHVNQVPNDRIVLFGESRGASTVMNYLGSPLRNEHVKAAIMDSPFATLDNVVDHRVGRFHRSWLPNWVTADDVKSILLRLLRNYDPEGIQPLTQAAHVPKDVAALIICSKPDTQVPYLDSLLLLRALLAAGHTRSHLLIVDDGAHGWVMEGPHKPTYDGVVHAFRAQYGIEHNATHAAAGKEYFEQHCSPTIEQIDALLAAYAMARR